MIKVEEIEEPSGEEDIEYKGSLYFSKSRSVTLEVERQRSVYSFVPGEGKCEGGLVISEFISML